MIFGINQKLSFFGLSPLGPKILNSGAQKASS